MKSLVRAGLDRLLESRGLAVVDRESLYEWQLPLPQPAVTRPPSAVDDDTLRGDNPRLLELRARYAAFDPVVTTPLVWNEGAVRDDDLRAFRGHTAYVWQEAGARIQSSHNLNPIGYALACYYLQGIDALHLLDHCHEDGAFGARTIEIAGRTVSRDLLDSICEICFLERHLALPTHRNFRVLDIGAGYGRLAHRMTEALPGVQYLCTDAYAPSTFLSEYYLNFREQPRASVVPLDEIESVLAAHPVDLAINVHSFAECRMEAIEWWLKLLARFRVPDLMIVTNDSGHAADMLCTNEGHDMQPLFERCGYRIVAHDPKYLDPVVQRHAISPAHHLLFRLAR